MNAVNLEFILTFTYSLSAYLWGIYYVVDDEDQSILKETNLWLFIARTDAEVEAPILWPPDRKSQLIGKDPDALIEGRSRRGWQRMRRLHSITDSMDMSLSKHWEIVGDREAWCAALCEVEKSQTRLSDWTTIRWWGYHYEVERQGDFQVAYILISSVKLICSAVSNSLQHHGLQHARLLSLSPTPELVYSDGGDK